jgi:lysophospholipid acyltransferase (LPLAT)-like uncharacterized protein
MTARQSGRTLSATVAGFIMSLLLRAWGATWRVSVYGDDPFLREDQLLAALWHEGLLVGAYYFRDQQFTVMVSRSKDGELIESTLERMGFSPSARGSTSRAGLSALRGLLRLLKEGATTAIHVDGPRGPRRTIQPGILTISARSGLPIQPIAIVARPCIRFGSWDRMFLPLPFARIVCHYGSAVSLPEEADDKGLEHAQAQLQQELDRVTAEAEKVLGLI